MNATRRRKRATVIAPAYLRCDVFDDLCTAKGATSNVDRAALFGVDRGTIHHLRNHLGETTISTALHFARTLGCPVEALFGTNATSAADKAVA